MWALGLMSGTSADGIDVAVIRTDGIKILEEGITAYFPSESDFRRRLISCFGNPMEIPEITHELTQLHIDAVKTILEKIDHPIDIIGFHGQTIYHEPGKRTVQIGDGALLAAKTGIDVVYDFRQEDIKAGGQGAPLVPIYHHALFGEKHPNSVVLNIGGVANITALSNPLIGFDVGPGGALLDDWIQQNTGYSFDKDGQFSGNGSVHHTLVNRWMQHPYFEKPYPKSLDRDTFKPMMADLANLSVEDGARTLVNWTATAIIHAIGQLPTKPTTILVAGGGRLNPVLMADLEKLSALVVQNITNGDALEAQAFAFLAVRSLKGLPLTFPLTTGCLHEKTGGKLIRGKV